MVYAYRTVPLALLSSYHLRVSVGLRGCRLQQLRVGCQTAARLVKPFCLSLLYFNGRHR